MIFIPIESEGNIEKHAKDYYVKVTQVNGYPQEDMQPIVLMVVFGFLEFSGKCYFISSVCITIWQ